MKVGIIAAVARNGVIGVNGKIPWRYPADLRSFRRATIGKAVIMGRKTFESMGFRWLPERDNIVISSQHESLKSQHPSPIGSAFVSSMSSALERAERIGHEFVWVIGGTRVYAEALAVADLVSITLVPDCPAIEGDVAIFPFVGDEWMVVRSWTSFDDSRFRHVELMRSSSESPNSVWRTKQDCCDRR